MNYIVLDLEWNQSNTGDEEEVKQIPFEIIDFGAIKLNNRDEMIDEFNQLVKPQVYQHMHHITSKIIHLHMKDLQRGVLFLRSCRSSLTGAEKIIFSVRGDRWICLNCSGI